MTVQQRRSTAQEDDRFVSFLDADGRPPCQPPDECDTCKLFLGPAPGETWPAWIARIAGGLDRLYEEVL